MATPFKEKYKFIGNWEIFSQFHSEYHNMTGHIMNNLDDYKIAEAYYKTKNGICEMYSIYDCDEKNDQPVFVWDNYNFYPISRFFEKRRQYIIKEILNEKDNFNI